MSEKPKESSVATTTPAAPPPTIDAAALGALIDDIVARRLKDALAARSVDDRFEEEMALLRGTKRPLPHEQLVECASPVTKATFTARLLMPRKEGGQYRVVELIDYTKPDGWDRSVSNGGLVPDGVEIYGQDGKMTLRFGASVNQNYYNRDNRDVMGKPLEPQYRADYAPKPGSVSLTPEEMTKLGITVADVEAAKKK